MKNVAVVLSGCGFLDGAEIHESVLTLLHLSKKGASYQCFAPNIDQTTVTNHLTKEASEETRNVLVESARIARCEIKSLDELKASDFDAVIFPGGFGAALNLCDFATKGSESQVNEQLQRVVLDFHGHQKPMGAICIAPGFMSRVLGEKGVELTIGNDADTAAALEKSGARHIEKVTEEIHWDEKNKVVSTPAYMTAKNISQVDHGIGLLVQKVLEL